MCVSVLRACMFVYHVHEVPTEAIMVLDPLELEFHMVLSHHVGSRNWICVLWKSIQCS